MLEAGISPLPVDGTKAVAQLLGVIAHPSFRSRCEATPDRERGESHLCTYYDRVARRCGIWEFRPGECSLYFCGSDSNRPAREEWSNKAFQLESNLAQMALAHLGVNPREIETQVNLLNALGEVAEPLSEARVLEVYRESWNWAKTQSESDVHSWQAFDKP